VLPPATVPVRRGPARLVRPGLDGNHEASVILLIAAVLVLGIASLDFFG
jgi:hypothetical protein